MSDVNFNQHVGRQKVRGEDVTKITILKSFLAVFIQVY